MKINAAVVGVMAFGLGVGVMLFFGPVKQPQQTKLTPELAVPKQVGAGHIIDMQAPVQAAPDVTRKPKLAAITKDDASVPTREQLALEEQILAHLRNPSYLQTVTTADVLKEAEQLTPEQQKQLMAKATQMYQDGELDLKSFKPSVLKRYPTIAEGAPLPTREEQAKYDVLSRKLDDREYLKNLTFTTLMEEIKTLPPALKQEVADRTGEMIRKGIIDTGQFMGKDYAGNKDVSFFFN